MPPDPSKPPKPPIYTSAFICESAHTDTDGMVSAIRIGDIYKTSGIEFEFASPDGVRHIGRVHPPINVVVVILFRSEVPIDFEMRFQGRLPDGSLLAGENKASLHLDAGVKGATLKIDLLIDPRNSGEIWFELYIDDELAIKMPFRIDQLDHIEKPALPASPLDASPPQAPSVDPSGK
jgi:hypothetical protein